MVGFTATNGSDLWCQRSNLDFIGWACGDWWRFEWVVGFLQVRCLSCGLSGDFVFDLGLFKGDLWVLEDEYGSGFW